MSIYQQGLILPYTCLVANLRRSKKQSQLQMTQILKQIIQLRNASNSKNKCQILQQLKNSKNKLDILKSKLISQKNQQIQMYNICRKRVHLDKQINSKTKQSHKHFVRQFDREVIQFCCCHKKINQAKTIQKSLKDCQQLQIQVKLYEKAFKIAQSIQKNDLRPLKDWCYEHSHYLVRIQSPLQFKLISCSFINILNNINGVKAVQFLRKQVSTLILTQHDKQQLSKLTYMVLSNQNSSDYEYYSDSQKQQQYQNSNKQIPVSQNQKKETQLTKNQSNNHKQILLGDQLLFLSDNIYGDIKNSQLIDQVIQGGQQLTKKQIITKLTQIKNQSQDLQLQQRQNYLQEDYQHQFFQSISSQSLQQQQLQQQQQQHQSNQQMIPQQQKNQYIFPFQKYLNKIDHQKITQQVKKQNIKYISYQLPKIIIRKNKLDKNNLRKLLIQTKQQFIKAFSKIYQISFDTFFDKTLAIGISIIKTPHCTQSNLNQKNQKCRGSCPTCSKQINRIMKKIPGTMKNQSSLICRINGSLMNQTNYPVALPSKQIYSLSGLQEKQKHGKYYCVAQKKWYRKEQCRKVYLT